MGQASSRRAAFFREHPICIFCGGGETATTEEHCPPRSLFRERKWPEGHVFPACLACNGGTSDADLAVALMAHLRGHEGQATRQSIGIIKLANQRFPSFLGKMLDRSPTQARADARRFGLQPGPGQTYQDIAPVNVTPEMEQGVRTLATKLTKAIYYQRTHRIFPTNGGIRFQWFTNADRLENGRIVAIAALARFATMSAPITRTGQPLNDQFDYRYSSDEPGQLHVLSVEFGQMFGFVTLFSQDVGYLEAMDARIAAQLGDQPGADFLEWLSGGPPQ